MPADEDYGRRHSILQHSAASPAPAISSDRYQTASPADRFQQDRSVQNEKPTATVERLEPPERFQSVSERFSTERSGSDRLPTGERYQGVSERYPLGDCTQTTVSTERLSQTPNHCHSAAECSNFPTDRYQHQDRNQKYPDRFTPIQNIGSLDRYHNHGTPIERYSRTNTPTERYHTLYTDKERCSSSTDRYTPIDKYTKNDSFNANERHSSQNINTLGRHTPTERHRRNQNERDPYFSNTVAQNTDTYKRRERSRSSERKSSETFQAHTENYSRYGHDTNDRYQTERFPPIPCPERFATQERTERPERISFTQVPYMAPPSPAPASDRFIPPPPLSPTNTPSPDCYASNTFPSPTNSVPPPDRFAPPPPLSPSPTETFSPKKQRERYADRFPGSSTTNERYSQYQDRYKDRSQYYSSSERYPAPHQNLHVHTDRFVNVHDRFNNSERTAVPLNPHTPVERYTPQQQEPYYQYDRYPKFNAANINSTDPYMRRDLAYQHQFRVTVPFQQNPYQRIRYIGTPNRTKCCQYQDCYQLCKSSPCSSSSSSVTSQGKEIQKELITTTNIPDLQCQNINGYQQEKAIQCNNFPNKDIQCPGFHITTRSDKKDVQCTGYVSPNLRTGKIQCRHGVCASPSVEYVGQSGGRHVCATPPPRGSVGSADGSVCSDQCCIRRSQNTLAVTVW
ncbi:hypothetical protein FQA39_LY03024 [Lamprigera yunnana]|nr:hypothetical protein FQA39_LY03024 [Lamprigera yunnana]